MNRRVRITVAAAGFFVLLSVATASAECAWVLWINTIYTDAKPPFWFPVRGVGGQAACEATAEAAAADFVKNTSLKVERTVVGPDVTTPIGSSRYICLPDTIDPRAPKPK